MQDDPRNRAVEERELVTENGKSATVALAALGLLLGMILLASFAVRTVDLPESDKEQRQKTYKRTLAEGVKINRHGLYGVELVSCESCRLQKRKNGVLTFGGMNVLVLENLAVVLPKASAEENFNAEGKADSAREIARQIGISDSFLSDRGVPLSFSGLRINGLSVSRLGEDDIPSIAFTASSAVAVRGGLKLSDCVVHEADCPPHPVSDAMIVRSDQKLCLIWNGGHMDIN